VRPRGKYRGERQRTRDRRRETEERDIGLVDIGEPQSGEETEEQRRGKQERDIQSRKKTEV
jgi:hypothetical protein